MSTRQLVDNHIGYLPGVGPQRAEMLRKEIGVQTYLDLLNYFPYRYVDRSRVYSISELRQDMPYVQLRGVIRGYREEGTGRKKRLAATFSDDTGSVDLLWFKGFRYIPSQYPEGRVYIIFGKPALFRHDFSISHPEIDTEDRMPAIASGLQPVYNTTERMKSAGLGTRSIRELQFRLLKSLQGQLPETLPEALVKRLGLMPYAEAITRIHFPRNRQETESAKTRLKFEELFYLQLRLLRLKIVRKEKFLGIMFHHVGSSFNRFYREVLPFELTEAQKRVMREIREDCRSGHQMNRLLQGDVGSGKTIVALLAMLLALDNDCQACMLAPTEILARQHYAGISELLTPMGVEVALLVGAMTKTQREKILPRLASGELPIVVGTHALLESGVAFNRLGMAVIDEQHRFGVEQRARLWAKNPASMPHILIMSATPIPRTLAMTLYGDLDVSVIDTLPPGRKPVQTFHCYDNKADKIFEFLRRQLGLGHQAYVVFPMIEGSEKEDLKNIEDGYALYSSIFPDMNVTLVHGKMRARDKEAAMARFVSGESRILLATTVIEVGVNVPNANVMIIEDAGRFGLSQLHQLRGRVGRGTAQSYCILVTGSAVGNDMRRRIDVMVETCDGFRIAEEDMRIRGFGDIEGTRQSGREIHLNIANPATDGRLVAFSREIAEAVLSADPDLQNPANAVLPERLTRLFRAEKSYDLIS